MTLPPSTIPLLEETLPRDILQNGEDFSNQSKQVLTGFTLSVMILVGLGYLLKVGSKWIHGQIL